MKKFNDTFVSFTEELVRIGKNTNIHSSDPVVAEYLSSVKEDAVGVSDVYALKWDDNASKEREAIFPDADEIYGDGYLILIKSDAIYVYALSDAGLVFGAVNLAMRYDAGINTGAIYNLPTVPFRALKTFIPAREEIPFYKKVIDLLAYYGFNSLVVEVGGAMEYKRHPEIGEGWEEYTAIFKGHPGKSFDVQRCMPHNKDSIHWENGGGSFLLQDEIRDIVKYARSRGVDVIPEVPSLTHSDYLLTRHPELAENASDPIPDTYCPLNPDVYSLVFDVIDEVIEVFEPKTIHIAHDEWYSACMCDRCRGKDPAKLFSDDVWKIYNYIKSKDESIEVMMWGDMMVNCTDKFGNVRGASLTIAKFPTAKTVEVKGRIFNVNKEWWCYKAEETAKIGGTHVFFAPRTVACADTLPKDIIQMNWLHHYDEDVDLEYIKRGMRTVYGNFKPRSFKNWSYCVGRGVEGAAISNWSMMDKDHMQRMAILFGIAYSSMMMWSRDYDEGDVKKNTLLTADDLYKYNVKLSSSPHGAEIVSGTRYKIPHEIFWDGNTIQYDKDRIGKYLIEHEDGTVTERDIIYGCDIGPIHRVDYDPSADPDGTASHILEPIYSSNYETVGEEIYYKLYIPSDKPIKRITYEIIDEYKDKTEIISIKTF